MNQKRVFRFSFLILLLCVVCSMYAMEKMEEDDYDVFNDEDLAFIDKEYEMRYSDILDFMNDFGPKAPKVKKTAFESLEQILIANESPSSLRVAKLIKKNKIQNYGEALVYCYKNGLLDIAKTILTCFENFKEAKYLIWPIHFVKVAGKGDYKLFKVESRIRMEDSLANVRSPLESVLVGSDAEFQACKLDEEECDAYFEQLRKEKELREDKRLEKVKKIIEENPIQNYGEVLLQTSKLRLWKIVDYLLDTYSSNEKLKYTVWATNIYGTLSNCVSSGKAALVKKILTLNFQFSHDLLDSMVRIALDGKGDLETIKILMAELTFVDRWLFFLSMLNGNKEALNFLVTSAYVGSNLCDSITSIKGPHGENLLHCAIFAKSNKLALVKYLVTDCGINPADRDQNGRTPLNLLLSFGDYVHFKGHEKRSSPTSCCQMNRWMLTAEDEAVVDFLLKQYIPKEINIDFIRKQYMCQNDVQGDESIDYYRKESISKIEEIQLNNFDISKDLFCYYLKEKNVEGLKRVVTQTKKIYFLQQNCSISDILKIILDSHVREGDVKNLDLLLKNNWPIEKEDLRYIKEIQSALKKKKKVKFEDHEMKQQALKKVLSWHKWREGKKKVKQFLKTCSCSMFC